MKKVMSQVKREAMMEETIARLSSYMASLEEEAKEKFEFEDLTLTQMHYLETIRELKNPSLTELSVALKLTKPTVKVLIDKLVEKSVVRRVRSDSDRRSAHLHLTDRGELVNQRHAYAHQRIVAAMQEKITPEELDQLMELLAKIV